MNSYRWHSTKLMHGSRRAAIEPVERQLEAAVAKVDYHLDVGDYANALLAFDAVRILRVEYERLFVCSIHDIEGAVDAETRRNDH